jgi:hypothetical protein
MDGVVGYLLSVVDAAEKLVSLGVAGLRSEYLAKVGRRFIDATLLEKRVGLGVVGQEITRAEAEEEEKPKGKAHTNRRCRDVHH